MTIAEMHIGIDLGLRRTNSSIFGNLLREEKDYLLNRTIEELILGVINNERNTVFDLLTYQDIRRYYTALTPFILSKELGSNYEYNNPYVWASFPVSVPTTNITSGVLYDGVYYKVVVAGTTNLSTFGGTNPPIINDIFKCVLPITSANSFTTVKGETYKILNPGATASAWLAVGATSTSPNSVFTATSAALVNSNGLVIQNLSDTPSWAGTTLRPTYDPGYFVYVDSKSLVDTGQFICTGELTKGKRYRTILVGTTDFSSYGGYNSTYNGVDVIFTCSTTGTPAWDGVSKLIEVKEVQNRLVKAQDVTNMLQHSYGTSITSPICILSDNKIKVYYNSSFKPWSIIIDYIRIPTKVDYNTGVDSDVDASIHGAIVDLTVQRVAGYDGRPEYEGIKQENTDVQQNVKG